MNISVLLCREDMEMGIMCHKNHELHYYYFNYIYCYVDNNIVTGFKIQRYKCYPGLTLSSNSKHHRVVMIK